uniref:CSON007400 protein n=1 Tax=Culicoides sonorensis TaxID=179676 RepID=A0A336LJI8_CULSO
MRIHKNLVLLLLVFVFSGNFVKADEEIEVNVTLVTEATTTTTTEAPKIPCVGKGKVCVEPNQCQKGFVDGNSLTRSYNYSKECNATHVCCEVKPFDPKNADKCAIRNLNTFPQGPLPLNANFAEFPWQAMILRESTKSLLCGGIIFKKNFVLTAGDCVAGIKTIDILTKGGEWKLGSDEEGKDFQLVRLKSISLHPEFNFTKVAHNLAILHLERDYKFDQHIQQLCLDETDTPPTEYDYCVTTGWGQEALKIHKKDAIEYFTNVTILSQQNCTNDAGKKSFNPDVNICGRTSANACNFDFGSALACQTRKDSQEFVLKGIYTHNTGCFEPTKYGYKQPTLVFRPLPINANFAEFPWQAMILKESTKSLLCGGIIISKNLVLTSGDCVQGQKAIDVLTKGGEWKLGSDEEGIDYEIVRLNKISFHPYYSVGEVAYNLALLHTERDYPFNLHIQPLCLDETFTEPGPAEICVTTGWGKEALALHLKDAIEHFTTLSALDNETCPIKDFDPDYAICAYSQLDACQLDFGSALACQDPRDPQKYVLKGVYTQNNGCNSRYPTLLFTKLDIEWIKNAINKPRRG